MNPRFVVIDGKSYVWRELVRMRREQLHAVAEAKQLVLFEMREDCRPPAHRAASGRYLEPSLLEAP